MDKYDPQKRIGLLVDEWGTWWDEEPGTVAGHLFQQNSLRDALVASSTLDVFHKYTDRISMANIAQMVNVLQAMILTNNKGGMVLTPTYHVFNMYKVHQDATYLPMDIETGQLKARDNRVVPAITATASKNQKGVIHISLSNMDADHSQEITIELGDIESKTIKGEILSSSHLTDHNTFENPDNVKTVSFHGAAKTKNGLIVKLPAKSIVTLKVE